MYVWYTYMAIYILSIYSKIEIRFESVALRLSDGMRVKCEKQINIIENLYKSHVARVFVCRCVYLFYVHRTRHTCL